jgi:hypothetical protein
MVGPPLLIGGEVREPLGERRFAGADPVDRGEQVRERDLTARLIELLTGKPPPVLLRPGGR